VSNFIIAALGHRYRYNNKIPTEARIKRARLFAAVLDSSSAAVLPKGRKLAEQRQILGM
jgi:hypothetical protein